MTPPKIRAARLALGLTQSQAARLVGVDARSWRRWEAPTPPPRPAGASHTPPSTARAMPVPVWRLLALLGRPGVLEALEGMGE